MKQLEYLNNVERAKMLHELFPDEIPRFLGMVREIAEKINSNRELIKSGWEGQIFSFDFWLELSNSTAGKVSRYGNKLAKSSRLFSDQLFDGYAALFSGHCLQELVKREGYLNTRFKSAVEMLF